LPSLLLVLLCLSFFEGKAEAWGSEGHQVVAAIAARRLTPTAREIVYADLKGRTLESIALDADNYRYTKEGGWTAPLHYTNLPRSATRWLPSYCPIPPSCVVEAVKNYTNILRDKPRQICPTSDTEEPCALVFLTHFVGDIHQPLHAGYADDSGGNAVQVNWFGKQTNLHAVWDSSIIQRYEPSAFLLLHDLLQVIENEPHIVEKYLSEMDPVEWVQESFQIVKTDVYNFDGRPSNFTKAARYLAPNEIVLGEKYYAHNLPTVKYRIIAAGVRLAALLNPLLQ
jgi:hypothetical protein